uniref:Putative 26S proteasome non-ATPase regulatory subunit 11 n=1 Tax=Schistosoma japonicum TaxID=6182 RepID=C1LJ59_SCHJA|nr:putative 26S proteasome non-ATPase regulatory subunit 11 [Schistosoma japonicum]CAX74739.1 putative 26S proteasome non-ATPase regulatory subunit 11 [Schistosoma japonicum]
MSVSSISSKSHDSRFKDVDDKLIQNYQNIVRSDVGSDEAAIKSKEQAILELGDLLAAKKDAKGLADLILITRPFLKLISKAKAGRLVRTLVDLFLDLEGRTGQEIDLCRDCVEWANKENRIFLRQALETRLMGLYYENENYEEALKLGSKLLRELKKLDDKALLVEVQLMESRVYYRLGNLQRARASLTSARTTANGIYCPPRLQANLDLLSGILHAADERDFKTAFSYFYEAFEGFDSISSKRAIDALKYMLLSKIMLNSADEIPGILTSKLALKYTSRDIDAMREVGIAAKERSLGDFLLLQEKYKAELSGDPVISRHLHSFYDTLFGQNLLKLIEPYSRVQIDHIAKLINIPLETVEKKLSQMILDNEHNGILDQGSGVLVLREPECEGKDYPLALSAIQSLGGIVDMLFQKTTKLK